MGISEYLVLLFVRRVRLSFFTHRVIDASSDPQQLCVTRNIFLNTWKCKKKDKFPLEVWRVMIKTGIFTEPWPLLLMMVMQINDTAQADLGMPFDARNSFYHWLEYRKFIRIWWDEFEGYYYSQASFPGKIQLTVS